MTYRFSRPRTALQKARLDNITLVPASLLPFKATWQKIANQLPVGAILVCMPTSAERTRQTVENVVSTLRGLGRQVRTMPTKLLTFDEL